VALTRREFMVGSLGAAAAAGAASTIQAAGANDRIRVGIMGIRGRGSSLAQSFAERKDVQVACLCDVDSRLFKERAAAIERVQGSKPAAVQDYRQMLDDKELDAVVNATPDHWHALGTIAACQAGKDVYVEKPASHSIWEGRKMVEAARKYNRVVQLGTQCRSAPYVRNAIEFLRAGKLGDIHFVRVVNMKPRGLLSKAPDEETPAGVDYERWLGPAPLRRFNPNHFYGGTWNWKWVYSGGDIINDGIHQMDIARWVIDRKYPTAVYAAGGIYDLKDEQDTPDTQFVTYEYEGGLVMTFDLAMWTPYLTKTPPELRDRDAFPDWPRNATRVEVYGTKGMMMLGRHGDGWQTWGPDAKPGPQQYGRQSTTEHIQNFIECMWSRKKPNADIEEGHLSTLLCHLANASYRVGCRRLRFDGAKETFVGDEDANKLVKRDYRAPHVVPEEV
jgi:predicted dehydrogenase